MPHHLLDLPLLLQIVQRLPCEASINLQSVDEGGDGDEAVGLDVFVEFVGGGFVEDDGVVGLVFDCCCWRRRGELARAYHEGSCLGRWRGRGGGRGRGS